MKLCKLNVEGVQMSFFWSSRDRYMLFCDGHNVTHRFDHMSADDVWAFVNAFKTDDKPIETPVSSESIRHIY